MKLAESKFEARKQTNELNPTQYVLQLSEFRHLYFIFEWFWSWNAILQFWEDAYDNLTSLQPK